MVPSTEDVEKNKHEPRSADARVYKPLSTPLFLSSLTHIPVLVYQNWN